MPVKPEQGEGWRFLLAFLIVAALLVGFLVFYVVNGSRWAYAFLIAGALLPALAGAAFWLSDRLHGSRWALLRGLGWCLRVVGGLVALVAMAGVLALIVMAQANAPLSECGRWC